MISRSLSFISVSTGSSFSTSSFNRLLIFLMADDLNRCFSRMQFSKNRLVLIISSVVLMASLRASSAVKSCSVLEQAPMFGCWFYVFGLVVCIL